MIRKKYPKKVCLCTFIILILSNSILALDLEVVSVTTDSYYYLTGNPVTETAVIQNNGPTIATNVKYRFMTGSDIPDITGTIPTFHPYSSIIITEQWHYGQVGQYDYFFEIDSDNQYSETDETNNLKYGKTAVTRVGIDYDISIAGCHNAMFPTCGNTGCYYKTYEDSTFDNDFNPGCCWDDIRENFRPISCFNAEACTTDLNTGLCCDSSDNEKHPFTNFQNRDCTDGNTCFKPTETADIGSDGTIESCWWGSWYDPDEGFAHCAWFSDDCTEEEYFNGANPGSSEGFCKNSLRWVSAAEANAFGEYDTGSSVECCGDDSGEYLVRDESSIQYQNQITLTKPSGLEVLSTGELYVVSYEDDNLFKCDSQLTSCTEIYSILNSPEGVSYKKSNESVVFVAGSSGLRVLSCETTPCTQIALAATGNTPQAVATSHDDFIYFVDSDVVYKYDMVGYNLVSQYDLGTGTSAWAIDVDTNNDVWVSTYQDNRIVKLDSNLTRELLALGETEGSERLTYWPTGIDVDDQNNLYITEFGGHRSFKFHPGEGLQKKQWVYGEYQTAGCDNSHLSFAYKTRAFNNNVYISDRGCDRIIKFQETVGSNILCCDNPTDKIVNGQCVQTCYDGTPIDTCVPGSLPDYCDSSTNIVQNCNECGCPSGSICDSTFKECVPEDINLREEHYASLCLTKDSAYCQQIADQNLRDQAQVNFAATYLDNSFCNLISQSTLYCQEKVNVFSSGNLPYCGNNVCDTFEDCWTCNDDCGVCGDKKWRWNWYSPSYTCEGWDCIDPGDFFGPNYWSIHKNRQGLDAHVGILADPYPYGTHISDFYTGQLDNFNGGDSELRLGDEGSCSDRRTLVSDTLAGGGCLYNGDIWIATFITWIWMEQDTGKTFSISVDDDYMLLVWNNCGRGDFDASTCTYAGETNKDGPWSGYVSRTFTRGWNVVMFGYIEDGGNENFNYDTDVSGLLKDHGFISVMNSYGPIDNPYDTGTVIPFDYSEISEPMILMEDDPSGVHETIDPGETFPHKAPKKPGGSQSI